MSREYVTTKCIGYSNEGKGLVIVENIKIEVPFLINGETASISYINNKGKIQSVYLENLVESSANRKIDVCPIFGSCGGCQLLHMTYEEQLRYKSERINNLFDCFKNNGTIINDIIPSNTTFAYRNKVQVAFFEDYKGRILTGFYEEDSNRVVDRESCTLESPIMTSIINYFRRLIIKYRITPYCKNNPSGVIRYLLIKETSLGEVMLVIVTSTTIFPKKREIVQEITRKYKNIKSVIHNVNEDVRGHKILGEREFVLFGNDCIIDQLCGRRFQISSKSFYQVNHNQTEKLYSLALEKAKLKKTDTLLDAYCGIGTIGIIASAKVNKVIGVEIVEDAIENAKTNAKINNAKNVSFFAKDATKFILEEKTKGKTFDVVICDPPRGGCSKEFIDSILFMGPRTVVYISCNPITLVRDLKHFESKYFVNEITPVDMFPNTKHVETIVGLYLK